MNSIKSFVKSYTKKARKKRAEIFKNSFSIDENTKILDLGSENGSNIHFVLQGVNYAPQNVYIADIDQPSVKEGANTYGYVPVIMAEFARLPFDDNYFDIVYCSSVIEHVTVRKDRIWSLYSGKKFKSMSLKQQKLFSNEIQRLGKQYFVQTPYKFFPIESHTWLPFIALLPRRVLIPILMITNIVWVKRTSPDWYLLGKNEMVALFPDASIVSEKSFGLIKSIMAIKSLN